MGELFAEMLASLREGQMALDREVHPLLQAQEPDLSMLERLRDVSDEYARRARQLRRMMTERGADEDSLEEVDRLCKYFDGTAGLIAQGTGDDEGASSLSAGESQTDSDAEVEDTPRMADETCPSCGEGDRVNFASEDGRFRIWCAHCGHSTKLYPELDLARLEWRGTRDEMGRE